MIGYNWGFWAKTGDFGHRKNDEDRSGFVFIQYSFTESKIKNTKLMDSAPGFTLLFSSFYSPLINIVKMPKLDPK